MKNLLNKIIYSLVIIILSAGIARAKSLCSDKGFTIGYFNGMDNTLQEAENNRKILAGAIILSSPLNEPFVSELFYNSTQSKTGDVMEIYAQKLAEIETENADKLRQYWEFFWYDKLLASGQQDIVIPDWLKSIANLSDKFGNFLEDYAQFKERFSLDAMVETVKLYESVNLNPTTIAEYTKHKNRMITLLTEGQKLLLVAHSQGNLFVNHAYEHTVGFAGQYKHWKNSVGIIHVAPATSRFHGQYVLNSKDKVIASLLPILETFANIYNDNVTFFLPVGNYTEDTGLVNHSFINSYMYGPIGRDMILSLVKYTMNILQAPLTEGNNGAFTVTLTWDGSGDIDLYVDEPSGTRVAYYYKQGSAGYLDVDNTIAYGPEHYYASCDENKIQFGTYKVAANNYINGNGRIATIQISTDQNGALSSRSFPVPTASGRDKNLLTFFNVNVVKNEDGTAKITVE